MKRMRTKVSAKKTMFLAKRMRTKVSAKKRMFNALGRRKARSEEEVKSDACKMATDEFKKGSEGKETEGN